MQLCVQGLLLLWMGEETEELHQGRMKEGGGGEKGSVDVEKRRVSLGEGGIGKGDGITSLGETEEQSDQDEKPSQKQAKNGPSKDQAGKNSVTCMIGYSLYEYLNR